MESSTLSPLFGFEAMPLMEGFSLEEKVFSLNTYLHNKILKENLDIFIVGVPSGIRGIDMYNLNHFGEMALAVSFAVKADISVCCMYYGIPDKELFEYMYNFYLWKFGVINDYYHINCVTALNGTINDEMKTRYLTLEQTEISEALHKCYRKSKAPLFSIHDDASLKRTLDDMLSELTDNAETVR